MSWLFCRCSTCSPAALRAARVRKPQLRVRPETLRGGSKSSAGCSVARWRARTITAPISCASSPAIPRDDENTANDPPAIGASGTGPRRRHSRRRRRGRVGEGSRIVAGFARAGERHRRRRRHRAASCRPAWPTGDCAAADRQQRAPQRHQSRRPDAAGAGGPHATRRRPGFQCAANRFAAPRPGRVQRLLGRAAGEWSGPRRLPGSRGAWERAAAPCG